MSEESGSEIRLLVNGREIRLNPFVRGVMESVNLALVENLHTGEEEIRTLELSVKRHPGSA